MSEQLLTEAFVKKWGQPPSTISIEDYDSIDQLDIAFWLEKIEKARKESHA